MSIINKISFHVFHFQPKTHTRVHSLIQKGFCLSAVYIAYAGLDTQLTRTRYKTTPQSLGRRKYTIVDLICTITTTFIHTLEETS